MIHNRVCYTLILGLLLIPLHYCVCVRSLSSSVVMLSSRSASAESALTECVHVLSSLPQWWTHCPPVTSDIRPGLSKGGGEEPRSSSPEPGMRSEECVYHYSMQDSINPAVPSMLISELGFAVFQVCLCARPCVVWYGKVPYVDCGACGCVMWWCCCCICVYMCVYVSVILHCVRVTSAHVGCRVWTSSSRSYVIYVCPFGLVSVCLCVF